jgi:hypothetical protein
MKKRYALEVDVICHIFKKGTRSDGTQEPNDGSGGHATQDQFSAISEYKILAIPPKMKHEAAVWFQAETAKAKTCPYAHVASFKIGTQSYTNKSTIRVKP